LGDSFIQDGVDSSDPSNPEDPGAGATMGEREDASVEDTSVEDASVEDTVGVSSDISVSVDSPAGKLSLAVTDVSLPELSVTGLSLTGLSVPEVSVSELSVPELSVLLAELFTSD
jgi:hypothetical protein